MFQLNQTYTTAEFLKEVGISANTWKKTATRERYTEYLKNFISYTVTSSGRSNLYTITEIYQDYIKPNFKKKSNTVVKQVQKAFNFVWRVNEPETCTRVAAIMLKTN
mgnify:CR=1 FL=1